MFPKTVNTQLYFKKDRKRKGFPTYNQIYKKKKK